MSRKKSYKGRPTAELATLPDSAPITLAEFRAFLQISESEYFRRRAAGLIPEPCRLGPRLSRHLMAEARALLRGDAA